MSTSFGAIIHVTGDDYSIQDAIDNAGDVDTIVVHQGVYEENLVIDKSITLTSLALFDPATNTIAETLDDWVEYNSTFAAWEVADELINSTIIDGSGELKSTITIGTEEEICIEPIILGFTIQNGYGTLVNRLYTTILLLPGEDETIIIDTLTQYLGGGILSYLANPTLHYNKIQNNGGLEDVIKSGAGIYPVSSSDDIGFLDRTKTLDRDCGNDVFDFTHNFFENNFSSLGRHIGNRFFEGEFDLSDSVFDYWNCQDEGVYQTPIWVNIDDLDNLVAEDEENSGCLYFGGEVYVDPVSGNDDLNDGLSWEGAFYTITHAIASVVGTESFQVDIYLAEGVYSPSTNGEIFPIEMISYVNLIGWNRDITILDANYLSNVISIENIVGSLISDITITNGYADKGGGIYLSLIGGWEEDYYTSITLRDISIIDNIAQYGGGVIFKWKRMAISG